jgi:hypothetical protein
MRMDDTTYRGWWKHHQRVVRGETLNPAEQAEYDAGLAVFDYEEKKQLEDGDLAVLRTLRAEEKRLETAQVQLQAKNQRLDRQIWTLEGAYMMLTGLELDNPGYAASPV